jgi:ethanolamine-phosphate cytidylyltransferase
MSGPAAPSNAADDAPKRKPIRVWADGCFDMMHYGHANALRQARMLGDELVVGVHSDADIIRHKGPPVMNEKERYAAVRGCKWVNEVVEGAPYVTELSWLEKYNIDFCVHGEDISTDENGRDSYEEVKKAGRFRIIKRTDGVSTTDLVGRMLLMTKDHLPAHVRSGTADDPQRLAGAGGADEMKSLSVVAEKSPYTKVSTFLASTRMVADFAWGCRPRTPEDVVVYVCGGFDLFHVGHVEALRIARQFGTFLIVGIHDDETVNRSKGSNFPILNLHERVLSVLQCRYVDEVITGAPWNITEGVIKALHINVVVAGSTMDSPPQGMEDPYAAAKRLGIFRSFESPLKEVTTQSIIERILTHRAKYVERNRKKEKKEIALVQQQHPGDDQHKPH